VRRSARRIRTGALGVAGVSTLAILAAGSMVPLITGGFSAATIGALLASLGGNALAGWLTDWAEQHVRRAVWTDADNETDVLGTLASDLQAEMAAHPASADAVATLLERTAAIPAALDALALKIDAHGDHLRDLGDQMTAQGALLQALRDDLRRSDLIQGRLHHLLMRTLTEQTSILLQAYAQGTERLSGEVRTVLADVQALRDDLQAALQTPPAPSGQEATSDHTVDMHGGNYFGGAQIGTIGTVIAGDSYGGDRIDGDKHVHADDAERRKRRKRRDERGES
jgi:hypothetical protein